MCDDICSFGERGREQAPLFLSEFSKDRWERVMGI